MVWQTDIEKSHPFHAVACTREVVGAMLPFNFVRCPKGLFQFDLASGEALPAANHEVLGWKIDHVDACQNRLSFSWVVNETSHLRVVKERDGTIHERTFPNHSMGVDKTTERVFAIDEQDHLAIFSFVKGHDVARSIERWSMDGDAPQWTAQTLSSNAVRNDSVLLMWRTSDKKLSIEVFTIDSGERLESLRLTLADVVSVAPIDAHCYALLAYSGVYIIDLRETQRLTRLPGAYHDALLDWGYLAVDARAGKLLVATTGNSQRPGTNVIRLDL
jgi:hypothetical protein